MRKLMILAALLTLLTTLPILSQSSQPEPTPEQLIIYCRSTYIQLCYGMCANNRTACNQRQDPEWCDMDYRDCREWCVRENCDEIFPTI